MPMGPSGGDALGGDEAKRRQLRGLCGATAVVAALLALGFAVGLHQNLHLGRYPVEGVHATAQVVNLFVKGSTPWFIYRFEDIGGQLHERETTLTEEGFASLKGQPSVAVEYLRSDPSWSRLVSGEKDPYPFAGSVGITAGAALVFLAFAVFFGLGLNVTWKATGQGPARGGEWAVHRWGRVLWEPGRGRSKAGSPAGRAQLKAGTRMVFGAPKDPVPPERCRNIARAVGQVSGVREAHLPLIQVEGENDAPRQWLVVATDGDTDSQQIAERVRNMLALTSALPQGEFIDILPLKLGQGLLDTVRKTGCQVFPKATQ